MPSFEQPRAQAKSARELRVGMAVGAFAALMSAACEKIPPGPRHFGSVYERLRETGPGQTPSDILGLTLNTSSQQNRPATEMTILSIEGNRGPETNIGKFDRLAVTTYGDRVKASGEATNPETGTRYWNHTIVPFEATGPTDINHHRVSLRWELTRTDVWANHLQEQDYAKHGAMVARRLTLETLPDTLPRGPGPILQNRTAEGETYDAALNQALFLIAQDRLSDVSTEFVRQQEAATRSGDPNNGANCGVINSPDMPTSYYCSRRVSREANLVIDDVRVENIVVPHENGQPDSSGGVRVHILFHDPTAPVPNVLATPGT